MIAICIVEDDAVSALGKRVSKVDFMATTAEPMPDMPIDLMKENFQSINDVQTSSLPKGQVSIVMSSYDKTIGTF